MKSEAEMKIKRLKGLMILGMSAMFGCKKPYAPPAITSDNNYLVVQGIIAAGQDSTIINLSRTVNLSGNTITSAELNATVAVVSDQNVNYPIPQIDSGKYAAPPLNLDNAHKYRLQITTADGQTYASDYEPVKITPPIDTLVFNINAKSDGLNIYTNAHDPTNSTRYYRWDYTETYIYNSEITSDYMYDPNAAVDTLKVIPRPPAQQIHTCYITRNSSNIVLNSSAALSRDVINNNLITQIADTSEKILHRYSILVKQYALTADAYAFWTLLKKNTEQIGTIFDAQPSESGGNIHCTSNPSQPVIGYISVSTISQKRIFIDRSQLPIWPEPVPLCAPYGYCWPVGAPAFYLEEGIAIPLGLVTNGGCGIPPVPGYDVMVADYKCADCRYHNGGKTVVPGFWR